MCAHRRRPEPRGTPSTAHHLAARVVRRRPKQRSAGAPRATRPLHHRSHQAPSLAASASAPTPPTLLPRACLACPDAHAGAEPAERVPAVLRRGRLGHRPQLPLLQLVLGQLHDLRLTCATCPCTWPCISDRASGWLRSLLPGFAPHCLSDAWLPALASELTATAAAACPLPHPRRLLAAEQRRLLRRRLGRPTDLYRAKRIHRQADWHRQLWPAGVQRPSCAL